MQQWTTHKYSLLSSKCSLTHGMAMKILQGMSTPLSKLLSLCLSLFSQCSTAVLLCTCPDRLGESHSKFELTRNINSLHHRHIDVLLRAPFAFGTKVLSRLPLTLMTFAKVRMHGWRHICCHKNQTCDFLSTGLSFVSRSLRLPQAFYSNSNTYSL